MKTKVISYSGEQPTLIAPEDRAKILDVMLKQLAVLEQMTMAVWLIPEGTCVREDTKP